MPNVDMIADLLGSLAALGLLVVAHEAMRRRIPRHRFGDPAKGMLFGFVSALQMHYAFTPADGILVDLACVPVTLAGAFLGLRGCLVCVVIAIGMRVQVGGLGAAAGIAAILIAAAAGLLWNAVTAGGCRDVRAMLGLAAATSCSLLASLLLPSEVAVWFLREAAPVLVPLLVVAILAVGLLLERARRVTREEARLRAAALEASGEGFMPRQALEWALAQAATSGPLRGAVSVVAMQLRPRGVFDHLRSPEETELARRTFRGRLDAIAPKGAVAGAATEGLVLLVLPALSRDGLDTILTRIRIEIMEAPVHIAGTTPMRLPLRLSCLRYDRMPDIERIVGDIDGRAAAASAPTADPAPRAGRAGDAAGPDMLFETFDRLHALRFGPA